MQDSEIWKVPKCAVWCLDRDLASDFMQKDFEGYQVSTCLRSRALSGLTWADFLTKFLCLKHNEETQKPKNSRRDEAFGQSSSNSKTPEIGLSRAFQKLQKSPQVPNLHLGFLNCRSFGPWPTALPPVGEAFESRQFWVASVKRVYQELKLGGGELWSKKRSGKVGWNTATTSMFCGCLVDRSCLSTRHQLCCFYYTIYFVECLRIILYDSIIPFPCSSHLKKPIQGDTQPMSQWWPENLWCTVCWRWS